MQCESLVLLFWSWYPFVMRFKWKPNGPEFTLKKTTRPCDALPVDSSLQNQAPSHVFAQHAKPRRGHFPILSRDPSFQKTIRTPQKNGWFLKSTMVEKNGESTPRKPGAVDSKFGFSQSELRLEASAVVTLRLRRKMRSWKLECL